MGGMESISNVEAAEVSAKGMMEKANLRARRIIDEAGSKAKEIGENAAKRTTEQRTARIEEAIKRLEAENRKALADAQKEAAKVRDTKASKEALGRVAGKVADLILGE